MTLSFYDVLAPTWRQILGAAAGFLDKGAKHWAENELDPAELVEARLFPDMLPLKFQVMSMNTHTIGAIEGVKKGSFAPPRDRAPPGDYAACQKLVADTIQAVNALSKSEVDALQGRDVVFDLGERKLPFTAEGFLFSFSLPNFFFHTATAYDILRMKGVPVGKRDFLGQMRMKT